MEKRRMIIDTAMVILLPFLMAYSLIGETNHEILGIAMGVLFITHHIFNYRWYKNLFHGRYTFIRILGTIINLLLTAAIVLQMISGILVSKHIFTFLSIPGTASISRMVHLLCAYWSFMLMSAHLGLHVRSMSARVGIHKRPGLFRALSVLFILISGYGIYAFIRRQIAEYLFMKTAFAFFDYSEPVIFFLADYLAVMILTATVFYYISSFASRTAKNSRKKPLKPRLIIILVLLAAAAVLFVTMGMPYIRRHFIPVKIDRSQAAAMAAIDFGDRKILTVQFTRVGNSAFDDDVAAVSSASLMKDGSTLVGNAELLAEMIRNAAGGDLYAITTEKKYPSSYKDTCGEALKELNSGEESVLLGDLPDTSAYDTVFLVYPIWWGTVPKPVESFLKQTDLSNAVIYTVVTHGGSREGSCIRDMKHMTSGTVSDNYLTVYDDDADTARDQIAAWLKTCAAENAK